jgi:hypothetical protein
MSLGATIGLIVVVVAVITVVALTLRDKTHPIEWPRFRKVALIIVLLIGLIVLISTLVMSSGRCPLGQRYVDQGDCEQCFQGCVSYGSSVKPIIYLYPEETIEVSVRTSYPELFTAEYPPYGEGWQVVAEPGGNLVEVGSGRELYALYYESDRVMPAGRTSEGFVVAGDEVLDFLETMLPQLGLSPREAEEFIVYWLPILQDNPYTYLRFETLQEQAINQELIITPTPDTLIRVMMDWQSLDQPIEVTPQVFSPPVREGFTVVEWGGTEILG